MSVLKNDLLLRALLREPTTRRPISPLAVASAQFGASRTHVTSQAVGWPGRAASRASIWKVRPPAVTPKNTTIGGAASAHAAA